MRKSASRKYITMRSMAINSGAILGPAIGAGLYYVLSFTILLFVAVGIYLFLALFLSFLTFAKPEMAEKSVEKTQNLSNNFSFFVLVMVLMGFYWTTYSQWSIVVPVIAQQSFGTKETSNLIFIANAVIVLVLQYPLLVILLKKTKDSGLLLAGFACFVFAFITLFQVPMLVVPILFCVLFSLGELLISPTLDSLIAKLAPNKLGLTKAYALSDFAGGISSMIGAIVGGALITVFGGIYGSALLCLPVALIAFIVIFILRRKVHQV